MAPYMKDQMLRLNYFPMITPLKHNRNNKVDRIVWALAGRLEHGRIELAKGEWNQAWLHEAENFPNPMVHDDLLDATAYIDQLATTIYADPDTYDEYDDEDDWGEIYDDTTGY